MKTKKIKYNQAGAVHWILPAIVTVIIAVVGVRVLTTSHASPTIPNPMTITNSNNGQTIDLQVGQNLIVDLTNVSWSNLAAGQTESSQSTWSGFSSSNTNILSLAGPTSYGNQSSPRSKSAISTTSSSTQSYTAEAIGQSIVSAQSSTSSVCGSGTVCPQDIKLDTFKVTVDVIETTTPNSVTITNSNNGQTISLQTGQTLIVALSSENWSNLSSSTVESNQSKWSTFSTSNPNVLSLTGATVYSYPAMPQIEPLTTNYPYYISSTQTYTADAVGQSNITAQSSTSPVCGPKTACPQWVRMNMFAATVNVGFTKSR